LTQDDIDNLDQAWRNQADAGSGPLIEDLLSRSVSQYLRDQQRNSDGLVAEVFVMDNLGLNVAQSDPTSDYWQGDEAKFQKTFGNGDVEFDDSSGYYQVQVSMTIDDPINGSPIGAATFGISME
jgi:nuclear transport factor 2 (NTF2) superfamily protein